MSETTEALTQFTDAIAMKNIPKAREIFLANKSLANYVPTEGNKSPAFHWAVLSGNSDLVYLFLENGADVHQKSSFGLTPIFNLQWSKASDEDLVQVFMIFLFQGIDINERVPSLSGKGTTTLLHQLAAAGKTKLCEHAIEHGADKNALDFNGWSPLMVACFHRKPETAIMLLKKGVDKTILAKNSFGYDNFITLAGDSGIWGQIAKYAS